METYLDLQDSFSSEKNVGEVVFVSEDILEFGALRKLLQVVERYGLKVPVPLVREEENESVGVGVS